MKRSSIVHSNYPDGRPSAEAHFRQGKLDGISRHWHPNGVMAFEIRLKGGFRHGLCKQWNEQGQLLGSFKMIMGTGVMRFWYSNSRLLYEMDMVKGKPHGRQRLWSEQGELVAESFYVNGKSVSFAQYRSACERTPDLPSYSSESLPPPTAATSVDLPRRATRL